MSRCTLPALQPVRSKRALGCAKKTASGFCLHLTYLLRASTAPSQTCERQPAQNPQYACIRLRTSSEDHLNTTRARFYTATRPTPATFHVANEHETPQLHTIAPALDTHPHSRPCVSTDMVPPRMHGAPNMQPNGVGMFLVGMRSMCLRRGSPPARPGPSTLKFHVTAGSWRSQKQMRTCPKGPRRPGRKRAPTANATGNNTRIQMHARRPHDLLPAYTQCPWVAHVIQCASRP